MKQCVNGHVEITWYDDSAQCPVCKAKEDAATKILELEEKLATHTISADDDAIGKEEEVTPFTEKKGKK